MVDIWDVSRDARLYAGPYPVVAHPPCNLWSKFAKINYARWGGAHNRPGNDGGCFKFALECVRQWGGVLEHPAYSTAWSHFKLPVPKQEGWLRSTESPDEYVCEVWQSAYGHKARKRTWLFYSGLRRPSELDWTRHEGTHQIGRFDVRKPVIEGRAASATPPLFGDALLKLARRAYK